jgi:hypothetical protein
MVVLSVASPTSIPKGSSRELAMATDLDVFLDTLTFHGLEHFNKYYGHYRAVVADNKDPEKRGRIKVYSPDLNQKISDTLDRWVDPAFDYACGRTEEETSAKTPRPKHGTFWPPEIGDFVRVAYLNGDPSYPNIYWGGWYIEGGVPEKLGHDEGGDTKKGTAPIKRGMVTKAGHALVFNDKEGEEAVELSWKDSSAKLTIDKKATVTLITGKSSVTIDKDGKSVKIIDENENTILLNDKGVTITTKKDVKVTAEGGVTVKAPKVDIDSSKVTLTSASGQAAVLGDNLKNWLENHVHGTGTGPSTQPLIPPPPSILSTKAKLG